MGDTELDAPLAQFAGAVPPAPVWFTAALADTPDRSIVTVDGANLELLTWGQRGKPGLLLLHGAGAHAGWWSFIAPFFAADYRVAALSWSGTGGSDHRPNYAIDGFVAEIFAAAEAAGLFDTAVKPLVVGHSFGSFPMMAAVATVGERFAGAVIVDTPFIRPGEQIDRPPNATDRPHRLYPTLAAALARFRFAPVQPCANPYIVDHIARGSLVETIIDGQSGWTWRFDPYLWSRFDAGTSRELLDAPRCPVALIWGEHSALMPPERVASMRQRLPQGTPAFAMPDAYHHVMVDQPLALVAGLRAVFAGWDQPR